MTKEQLRAIAIKIGFTELGVCSGEAQPHVEFYENWLGRGFAGEMEYLTRHLQTKSDVRHLLPSCRSIIAVTLDYNQPNPHLPGEAKIARYALGRDYHKVVNGKLKHLQNHIAAEYPEAEFRICVDSVPLFEREYAHLAGLGWFGKNTCLINSRRGSWFFIGILLCSVEFVPDLPSVGSCGTCTACIEACPTGAIVNVEERWQIDARNCISYLTIEKRGEMDPGLAQKLEGWTFGCDICQEVCPFNQPRETQPQRAQPTAESQFLPSRQWPNLVDLAVIPFEEWDRLTQGSPVRRAGWEGLKRNARLNLETHRPEHPAS